MENVLLGPPPPVQAWAPRRAVDASEPTEEETEARRICMHMLERFGLAEDAHRDTGDLSLGNQKLVEVARAMVAEPKLLLLDEPAAGLGADDVTVLLRVLRELVAEQSSV